MTVFDYDAHYEREGSAICLYRLRTQFFPDAATAFAAGHSYVEEGEWRDSETDTVVERGVLALSESEDDAIEADGRANSRWIRTGNTLIP